MRELFTSQSFNESENEVENEEREYDYFEEEQERAEIFQYCKAVAEYLREKNIPNLVLVDNSARLMYIGVREYFKYKYPGEDVPNIYFVNPQGFKSLEHTTFKDIYCVSQKAKILKDPDESILAIRDAETVQSEFQETYKKLLEDKDKPVLIFDTCIHSGDTLSPIKRIFQESGFSDVLIGSITPAEEGSSLKEDFHITEDPPSKMCRPFSRDYAVEKTYTRSSSKLTRNPKRIDRAIELRKEIKYIMKDYLNKEGRLED